MTSIPRSNPDAVQKTRPWLWLLGAFCALLVVTAVFTAFDLDRAISGHFYRPEDGWYLGKQPLWAWLYKYGTIPGIVLAVGCLIGWLLSFYTEKLRQWRRPCLVVVLTTVLAAGVLVNAVLKQYWGRPRPSQTIDYGGNWEYRPVFPPGVPGKGASFPCGHCTMGFVFLATAAFYRRSKPIAVAGVGTGLVLGGLLSAARVVQGAHFTSDTIWAMGIVGLTAAALTWYLPDGRRAGDPAATGENRRKRLWLTIGTCIAISLMAAGFLTRRPYFTTRHYPLKLSPGVKQIVLQMPVDPERVRIEYSPAAPGQLQVDAHGFGWIKFKYDQSLEQRLQGQRLFLTLKIKTGSYFAELDHALTLTLPKSARQQLKLQLNGKAVIP